MRTGNRVQGKKIAVVTGTRADFGIYTPVLREMLKSRILLPAFFVTGTHLSHHEGYTVRDIEAQNFPVASKVEMLLSSDTPAGMIKSFALTMTGFVDSLLQFKPDAVMVLGDRGEQLAAAVCASFLHVPVIHLHGGEISGSVDEVFRHAITKLSHIHFPSTKKHAERIVKLGENKKYVFVSGAPALDTILHEKRVPKETLYKKYGLDAERPLLLMCQHPVVTEASQSVSQIREVMEALTELNMQTVVFLPNADAGGLAMRKEMQRYMRHPLFHAVGHAGHNDYLSFLSYACCLVGNTSSGLVEAPSFGLPYVLAGSRQEGRERGGNVIAVSVKKNAILHGIHKAMNDKEFLNKVKKCRNPFGDGKASMRIRKILEKISFGAALNEKRMMY